MSAVHPKKSFLLLKEILLMDLLYSCSGLDLQPKRHPIPNAMVNLETWLPSNFQVDDWKLIDLGPLGTGGR